jgi:2-keto-4-pentenoate hydratase/2-oxohepta-3-ene-1,7-dioic acid hydratase in catechol pathway
VLGLTCLNDVTARHPEQETQHTRAKGRYFLPPFGPCVEIGGRAVRAPSKVRERRTAPAFEMSNLIFPIEF